jgi:hypothetical protein
LAPLQQGFTALLFLFFALFFDEIM